MNYMLEICKFFAEDSCIIFNSKKTVCLKFGSGVLDYEKQYLLI